MANTKKELQHIWEGFNYHCEELTRFMIEHKDDPFFETQFGKEIKVKTLLITSAHISGMMKFFVEEGCGESSEEKNPNEETEGQTNPSVEDALKELFGEIGKGGEG